MGLLDLILGNKPNKIEDFKNRGAVIIDVRMVQEYQQGAIKGSKNIPLQTIESKIDYIKGLKKPIITCCVSGMRSASAVSILKSHGIEVLNGGGWTSLKSQL